jgi:hypothetical protein
MRQDLKTVLIVGVLVGTIGLAGSYVVNRAYASSDHPASDFIAAVAAKLGINTEDLQTAVDEVRTEERTTRIADAIAAGDLTQEQAALLEKIQAYREEQHAAMTDEERAAQREEMQTRRQGMRDATEEERQTARDAQREEEIQELAQALGESEDAIREVMELKLGYGMGGGGHGRGGFGPGRF